MNEGAKGFSEAEEAEPQKQLALWRQECEAAGCAAFTVRKQRDRNAGARLTFSCLLSLEPHPQGSAPRV